MRFKKIIPSLLLITYFIFSTLSICAQEIYTYSNKIVLPDDGSSDFLSIDSVHQNLYVTHAANVHIIDLKNQQLLHTISGFKGARGVAIVNSVNKGFISDGKDNSVTVFNLLNFEKIISISLTGKKPSTIIFDAYANKVFAFNTESHSVSVIDIDLLKEVTSISLPGEPEFVVADGKGSLYINLEDKNSIAVVNTKTLQFTKTFPLPNCKGPFALAMDVQNNLLFSGCRENKSLSIIQAENQQMIATFPIGSGVGAIGYDNINKTIILSNADATANIFYQHSPQNYRLIQTLKTELKAKTFVMDTKDKNLYFSASQYNNNTIVPNSFAIFVYKRTIH